MDTLFSNDIAFISLHVVYHLEMQGSLFPQPHEHDSIPR